MRGRAAAGGGVAPSAVGVEEMEYGSNANWVGAGTEPERIEILHPDTAPSAALLTTTESA